jgi:hypothetical protein
MFFGAIPLSNSKYETCHGIELQEKENPMSQIPKEWRLG